MTADSLITYCKYYHGEDTCPFGADAPTLFWTLEREWVSMCPSSPAAGAPPIIEQAVREYLTMGLAALGMDDDTPISLKAYIFLRTAQLRKLPTKDWAREFPSLYAIYTK